MDILNIRHAEKLKTIRKLHNRFGHTLVMKMRNRDRPQVSLPLASQFNEKVCIDLNIWKKTTYFAHNRYIQQAHHLCFL